MLISIQKDARSPIYRQIVDQVKAQIADGTLDKGDKLPSVRELSRDLGVNVNTVHKAYKELEAQGIVRVRMGLGVTVIADRRSRLSEGERERIIHEMADHLRVEAYHLGFDDNYLTELFRRRPKGATG